MIISLVADLCFWDDCDLHKSSLTWFSLLRWDRKGREGWNWLSAFLTSRWQNFCLESRPLLWKMPWAYYKELFFCLSTKHKGILFGFFTMRTWWDFRGKIHSSVGSPLRIWPPGVSYCQASLHIGSSNSSKLQFLPVHSFSGLCSMSIDFGSNYLYLPVVVICSVAWFPW